jgi:glycosyltransferase involved in cell wall biosynthesis
MQQANHKRTRILFVEANEDGSVGGSHKVLYDMVKGLNRQRFDPVVLFYQNNRYVQAFAEAGVSTRVWEDVRERELSVHRSGRRAAKLLEIGWALLRRRRFLKKERIDLVHINNSPRTGRDDWLPAARLVRIPIVASARGDAEPLPGRGPKAVVHRWLMRRFDRVAAVSEYIANAMRAQGIAAERVVVVHDGVDQEALNLLNRVPAHEMRRDLGVPPDRVFVAMIGNIRPWKGQHVVLEALSRMTRDDRERLYVVFVGEITDEYQSYYEELKLNVEVNRLSDVVSFAGSRTDVPQVLSAADVAVHSSVLPEPGGTVVIEAMTFGAPVIVASRGGHLDYLCEGVGLIHDVDQPEELARHLARLGADPQLRDELSEAGKLRAANFSIDRTTRHMEALYGELLGP